MGLKNREDQKTSYLKLKNGKFILGKGENEVSFDELEGQLVDLYLKDDTFEGQIIRKLYLVFDDNNEKYIVGFNFESQYTSTLLSFLKNVDVSRIFSISPIEKQENVNGKDVIRRSLLVKQDGKFVKAYFTKATPNGLPQMKKVKFNGKEVWDKTDLLAFYEDLISEFRSKLQKGSIISKPQEVDDVEIELPWEKEVKEEVDDLPF